MSDQVSTADSVVVTYQPEVQSFLTDKVQLDKLLKELVRYGKSAVKVLVDIVEDPKADAKLKLTAATKLLEFQVQVAKEISSDQLQRLIAEIKYANGPRRSLVPLEDDTGPVLDFTNIREVK